MNLTSARAYNRVIYKITERRILGDYRNIFANVKFLIILVKDRYLLTQKFRNQYFGTIFLKQMFPISLSFESQVDENDMKKR